MFVSLDERGVRERGLLHCRLRRILLLPPFERQHRQTPLKTSLVRPHQNYANQVK